MIKCAYCNDYDCKSDHFQCSNKFDCNCPVHYHPKDLDEVQRNDAEELEEHFDGIIKNQEKYSVGVKHDKEKIRWSLLPFDALEEVIKVLMHGSKKYADFNWIHVDNGNERYFNAAMRHLIAWKNGEKIDPESNLNHCAHACVNCLFLLYFELHPKNKK